VTEIGLLKSELDTPALWVDLNTLESNIGRLAHQFKQAGVHWRPHTKSLKIPALAHMAIDAGAIGVTCAKLGEAEVMDRQPDCWHAENHAAR
jgi:D-serine deaminase-like pyridoxal phosphate-dependent protein